MARTTVTRLVDDLGGGVAHETVKFGLDGQQFEIDLSSKNAKKLRSELAAFVEHGNRISTRVARPGRTTDTRTTDTRTTGTRATGTRATGTRATGTRTTGTRATGTRTAAGRDQNRAIREWAQAKGYDIAPRGRIKQDIVEAFHQRAGR